MAQTMTIEQAQAYLRENEYGKLRALICDPYYGSRNATICNGRSAVMVLKPKEQAGWIEQDPYYKDKNVEFKYRAK